MQVVLIKKVEKLGQAGEVKRVTPGFARNFLLPRNLAVLATPGALKMAEQLKKVQERKAKGQLSEFQTLIKKLAKLSIKIKRKASKEDKLFAAVDVKSLSGELQARKMAIDPKFIKFKEPIKKLGEYQIPVEFTKELKGKFKLVVEKE